ncbi:MAG: hypothetical protein LBD23_14060 [Oscillospiraceae bacterium]|nr:hypothetical protein [Oscillospiraceae bacterium]
MNFNNFLAIAQTMGIENECEKERMHDKFVYSYRLYSDGKHGQKFITITDPDSQMSKEQINDLYKFIARIQEQDK